MLDAGFWTKTEDKKQSQIVNQDLFERAEK